ncbi:SCO1/SenC-domain-containing protein [Clohesyomyces aquaticus]|uniref:SCO1/SenC-domain-containing protein n=1 Tax=Clohesyomyces aquaticus TaxID=1231657 RepID=A0A1Y1YR03_9PLEO|nr:SCO1/SenC-domain-containing protein [Clohesyomyces aquaticus]
MLRHELKSIQACARPTYAASHAPNPTRLPRTFARGGSGQSQISQASSTRCRNAANSPPKSFGSARSFTSSTARSKMGSGKTVEEVRSRNRSGPFSLTSAVIFVAAGAGMYMYFTYEKERMYRKRIAEDTKGVGRPKVGGPFELVDQDGMPFTSEDMKGKYSLVYFGFSHCPDICPDELDKMAIMYDTVTKRCGKVLLPIMITCDPARDTPAVLKEYLKEFHPEFIGLTGDYEEIKKTCKEYRVYFSTPPNVKPGQDYLVDHSIYFYLMDPDGDFVEAIGRNFTAADAAQLIGDHITDWTGSLNKKDRWA